MPQVTGTPGTHPIGEAQGRTYPLPCAGHCVYYQVHWGAVMKLALPLLLVGASALERLRFTEHELRPDGPGPVLSSSDAESLRQRRLSVIGALLGDLALTTVSGTLQCDPGQTQGCSKVRLAIEPGTYGNPLPIC